MTQKKELKLPNIYVVRKSVFRIVEAIVEILPMVDCLKDLPAILGTPL